MATLDTPEPTKVVESCPVCGGKMRLVYQRPKFRVCVCADCFTGISIPAEAWDVMREKRAPKRPR